MSGSNYALEGGFWVFIAVMQTPGTSLTTNGPNLEVTVPSPAGNEFYRLKK